MNQPAGTSLLDRFAVLEDSRQAAKVLYPLPEIILLLLGHAGRCGRLCRDGALGQGAALLPAPLPALPARHSQP